MYNVFTVWNNLSTNAQVGVVSVTGVVIVLKCMIA